jgi:serine/threonine protein kinase
MATTAQQQEVEQTRTKSRKERPSGEAPREKLRSIGRWYIGETLGKGGYSWVKKGYDKKTGKPVALKFMAKADASWAEEQTKQVITEIEALKQVRHQHVMKLYAYNLNAKYPTKAREKLDVVLLVLEYAPGGELFDILYYTSALEEDIARTYFRQMILGLEACHRAGIAHRDIKPQNLLLDSHFNLKLTDFGLSKVFESDADTIMHTTYVGTRGYQAPELLLNQPYDLACDIFSAGVVLFILLTGYPPFEQAHKKDRWFAPLVYNDTRRFWKGHHGCAISNNDTVKDIIQKMLEFDPTRRITIDEIKQHPWVNQNVLEGKGLINVLRQRHRKMEINRRKDLRKVEDLNHSIIKRDLPQLKDVSPPLFPSDFVRQLKDVRTRVNYNEVADHINGVLCANGANVEVDAANFRLEALVKILKNEDDEQHSLVKFNIHFWREAENSEYTIVRFSRLEGDAYDFFKVRQLIDKLCNPVFIEDEDLEKVSGKQIDDDDYDKILEQDGIMGEDDE